MSEAYVRHRHVPHRLEGRENFADAGRTDRFYRFSVKCDREENDKIAKMAKAAGMTPTDFVQRHFETIFKKPKAADNENVVEAPKPSTPKPDRLPLVERLYEYMVSKAGKDGRLTLGMVDVQKEMCVGYDKLRASMDSLMVEKRVVQLTRPSRYTPATYKIL